MIAAGSLAQFQEHFTRALMAPDLPAAPAFAVYRNTVMKGCIDALQANYPAVARLVGEEWFRAAAAVYARENPPRSPMLLDYGGDFAGFIARFEPAAQLPYLPAVAALDRYWSEAHTARDETPLAPQSLSRIEPACLGRVRLRPHAAARWTQFALPAYTIWSRNRLDPQPGGGEEPVVWRDEGALITRPGDAVASIAAGAADCAFMDGCASGQTLEMCAQAALLAQPGADLAMLMARLLEAGAFAELPQGENIA